MKYDDDFKTFIENKYKNEIKFKNINYLTCKNIKNFKELIGKLDTKDIVNWLNQDEELKNLLSSEKKNQVQVSNQTGADFTFIQMSM